MKPRKAAPYERYEFAASPWRQNLTQRDLAKLLGFSKSQLEALIRDKDRWIDRRAEVIGGKQRQLSVPKGRLRAVHDRLKYHLNKIKQPNYLFSPRKGRGQRDNAGHHTGQTQFLKLDIEQFYPSTTSEHIFRWAYYEAGLRSEVSGMLAHLVSIDGKMPFGSPVSPVLTTLVHREAFDAINTVCADHGLTLSVWVDDIVISGERIPGEVVELVRGKLRAKGFRTHKIGWETSSRPVIITGVPLVGRQVAAPKSVHERIQAGYLKLQGDLTDAERASEIDRLLSALGTFRYHVGRSTLEGRKAADRMMALRQRRAKLSITITTLPEDSEALDCNRQPTELDATIPPWEVV